MKAKKLFIIRYPLSIDMKFFTELYNELDQTNKTNEKVEALKFYFERAEKADAAWALYFLSGRKPRQIVPSKKLREWAMNLSGVEDWLYDECYHEVGDGAETIALLLPFNSRTDETPLHVLVEEQLLPLRGADEETQKKAVLDAWSRMNYLQRLIYNKLISGSFRVGVPAERRALCAGHPVDGWARAARDPAVGSRS